MREDALLQHIYGASAADARITIPPGDDMGALRIGEQCVLATVDQLADGLHVRLAETPLRDVARKAIGRSLSDVAAMAARPCAALATAALPRDFGEARANDLFDAMRDFAGSFDCPLIGGDIAMWDQPLQLTVTVLAEPAGIEPVLRRGALVGDALYVTGRLGGSLETMDGRAHHLAFEPRVAAARALAGHEQTRPHAMIDLSDGLGKDLTRLCEASGVGAMVEAARLPIREAARDAARRSGRPLWRHAVGDGEDYELLFAANPDDVPAAVEGAAVTCIGRIVDKDEAPAVQLRDENGETFDLSALGWEHHG